jgi:hypothetical protein
MARARAIAGGRARLAAPPAAAIIMARRLSWVMSGDPRRSGGIRPHFAGNAKARRPVAGTVTLLA